MAGKLLDLDFFSVFQQNLSRAFFQKIPAQGRNKGRHCLLRRYLRVSFAINLLRQALGADAHLIAGLKSDMDG